MRFKQRIALLLLSAGIYSTAYSQDSGNEWDNGYTQAQLDYVLSVFSKVYTSIISERGGQFEIESDWTDGAVNAFAWRERDIYRIEVPGGLSRYALMTEDAYIALICHELGHLLGGEPLSYDISFEGQSDYYSTNTCLKKILPLIKNTSPEASAEVKDLCGADLICQRSLMASLSLGRFDARIAKVKDPQISTPDKSIVEKTLQSHPQPQCRLDTRVAGALNKPRPSCWYKANLHNLLISF